MSAITGISVIIPNYNGELLLPQVLPTVYTALNNSGFPSEIIIVDDCSADGSLQLLKEKFPAVKVLQNEVNSGFSITSNRGIRAAIHDWVLLLNSDVKLEPDYFKSLLKYTNRDNIFGIMGRIVGWEVEKIQDGAKYPFFHGIKIKTSGNYLLKDEKEMENGLFTMYLSGANAFMNKKHFMAIGGFNELFSPFYVEDFELSLRAWRLGYECYYDHCAICRN
jgi:GT2 family glycosyltransferase